MTALISQLAEIIAQDNALLLIGASFRGDGDRPETLDQVAEALAQRIDYRRPDRSLPAVARDFEILQGRRALIQALKEEIDRLADRPRSLLQQITDAVLPHSKVITSRFDQVLERSLESSNKPYVLIVRDTDLPSFDESKVTLIKMRGDIDQPDSLVITEDDIDRFLQRLPAVSDVIRAFFATKTLIFLGFDLESDLFKRLYRQVSGTLSAFNRPAYAIVSQPLDPVSAAYWEKQNLTLHEQDLAPFVTALTAAIRERTGTPGPEPVNPLQRIAEPPRPAWPFKGLDSFQPGDAAVFAGRETEIERLTNQILAHRAGALYGESGSGKTSLLLAGVGPRLARRRALLVHSEPHPEPALEESLLQSLTAAGAAIGLDAGDPEGLQGAIRALQESLGGPVVLALDPFEPISLTFPPAAQTRAAALLKALVEDRTLDLRLIFVVREDDLGRMQALEAHVPGILDVRFRLERLGREAARAAIVEPAARFGVSWDRDLVELLLDELQPDPTRGIAPPQLQIVCDRLYREAVGDRPPGREPLNVTIDASVLDRLGGVRDILSDHLEAAVADLPEDRQEAARRLLGALVSASGRRQRLRLSELQRAADIAPEVAAEVLSHLNEQRLVQRYQATDDATGGEAEFELVHDTLAGRILTWLGADFWEAQRVREAVRQALPAWRARRRLMSPEDLQLVVERIESLRFSAQELELIFANAVAYGAETEPWSRRLDAGRRRELILELISHSDAQTRRQAALALGPYAGEDVSEALADAALEDPDPRVREAAAVAVGRPKAADDRAFDQGAVTRLGAAAAGQDRTGRAIEALVTARDRQPDVQPALPAGIAGHVRRQVWRARWRRERPTILVALLRGLQSGFWGLALGMGVFLGLYNADLSLGAGTAIRFYLGFVFLGITLAGVLGALAVGAATFLRAALFALQDRPHPVRTWALTGLVSGGFFGLGLVLIGEVSAGTPRPGQTFLAGLIIGVSIAVLAGLPWMRDWLPRLILTAVGGMATFVLVGLLGLFFDRSLGWLVLMGLGCGIGYFFGLAPGAEPGGATG